MRLGGCGQGLAWLVMVAGAAGRGQSTLPATSPTAGSGGASVATAPAVAREAGPGESAGPVHLASVTYVGGKLTVVADNSSLNQILREISRQTGIKITGGVVEERVFGSFGPDDPGKVLSALLEGTGSNLMLRESSEVGLAELILTPRHGGPTPPNPNSPGFDDAGPPEMTGRPGMRQLRTVPANSVQPAAPMQASAAQTVSAAASPVADAAANGDGSGAATPGPKTPEQVYQQLMQLQQRQTQQH